MCVPQVSPHHKHKFHGGGVSFSQAESICVGRSKLDKQMNRQTNQMTPPLRKAANPPPAQIIITHA